MGIYIFAYIEYRGNSDSGWVTGSEVDYAGGQTFYQLLGNNQTNTKPPLPYISDNRLEPLRAKDEHGWSGLNFQVSYAFHGLLELMAEDAVGASYVTLAELIEFRNDPDVHEKMAVALKQRVARLGNSNTFSCDPWHNVDYTIEVMEMHREFYSKWHEKPLSNDEIRLSFFFTL